MTAAAAPLENAYAKLSGHVVQTPLIGGNLLPGLVCPRDLRLKPESLQTSGGVWFRGAMHELASHYGSLKGVVVSGAPRLVYATVCAAILQRVPVVAVPIAEELDADLASMFVASECEFRPVSDPDAAEALVVETMQERGFSRMPGLDSAAFADGIATLGLELAKQLPFDTATVIVAPSELAAPIERGLRAGGRGCAVRGVDPQGMPELRQLAEQLRVGARIVSDPEAVAALHSALSTPTGASPCVVLSS